MHLGCRADAEPSIRCHPAPPHLALSCTPRARPEPPTYIVCSFNHYCPIRSTPTSRWTTCCSSPRAPPSSSRAPAPGLSTSCELDSTCTAVLEPARLTQQGLQPVLTWNHCYIEQHTSLQAAVDSKMASASDPGFSTPDLQARRAQPARPPRIAARRLAGKSHQSWRCWLAVATPAAVLQRRNSNMQPSFPESTCLTACSPPCRCSWTLMAI